MAEVQITFKAQVREAQASIQTLRGQIAQLNKTIASQRTALLTATDAERKNIRAQIASAQAQKATLRSRVEILTLQKQSIVQSQKEARETERAAKAREAASQRAAKAQEQAAARHIRATRQMSVAQQTLVHELTMGVRLIYQQLSQLTGGFVRSAADMETFRNTIHVVTQDTEETNQILARLLQLTVDLVGIDTSALISYAGRLMSLGLSADEAITAISGVTKRMAEQGRSAAETRMVMEQVTQSFNTGRAVMFDFRTLMRLMPKLWEDASNALGTTVTSTEDFNVAAAAAGGHTQALLALLSEMDRVSPGANMETLNAQMEVLSDLSGVLAAELGDHLIPALVAILKHVNAWIEAFINMEDWAQAAVAWSIALATALAGLATVVGTITVAFGALSAALTALTGASGIAAVTAGITGLTAAFVGIAPYIAVGGIVIAGLGLLAKAIYDTSEAAQVLRVEIKALDKTLQVYNLTTGQLETLTAAQAESYAKFQEQVKQTQAEVSTLTEALAANRTEQSQLQAALDKTTSRAAYQNLKADLDEVIAKEQSLLSALTAAEEKLAGLQFELPTAGVTEPLESLEVQLVRAVDEVLRLRDAFKEVMGGETPDTGGALNFHAAATAATALTTALQKELALQLKAAEQTAEERVALELETGREIAKIHQALHVQLQNQTAGANAFWEFAAAGATTYTDTLAVATASLVDHKAEQLAYEQVAASFWDGLSDPIADTVDALEATSVAADAAFGSLNSVGTVLRDADFTKAAADLYRYDDAFASTEITIPRVTSAMRDFTGTVADAGSEIDRTTVALQNLSQEAQAAARETELLDAAFARMDAFDARTPGRPEQGFDWTGLAVETGEELISTAIRWQGELNRIEKERVESLADLEQQYSDKIVAINEEKRERLAAIEAEIEAERLKRIAAIETAFATAAAAEVAARERASARILQIEARADAERTRLRERLNDRLIDLETQRDDRIQSLRDGLTERETAREAEILAITERASDAREVAEQQYADTVEAIHRQLVSDVKALHAQRDADVASLNAGLEAREIERAAQIVQITENANTARITATQTYQKTMEGIYRDLVDAWDALEDGFTERQKARKAELIRIETEASRKRTEAWADYHTQVSSISTDLVDTVRGIQSEITEITLDAAAERIEIEKSAVAARTAANLKFDTDIAAIESRRDTALTALHDKTLADRGKADQDYADTFQDIQNDLVDTVRGIQSEITEITLDAAAERIEIEKDAIDAQKTANLEYDADIRRIDDTRQMAVKALHEQTLRETLTADERYAEAFQSIQNRLVDEVVDIRRNLNETLDDLQDEALAAEQARADSLVELHAETQQKIEDIDRKGSQTREDIRREYWRDIQDAATRRDRELEDADSDEDRERAEERFERRLEDIRRENLRAYQDLDIREARQREAIQLAAAQREVEIAEQTAERLADIEAKKTAARTTAQAGIASAETEAGVSFASAQENYIPALSAHEAALAAHAEALARIDTDAENASRQILTDATDAAAEATDRLITALDTIGRELTADLKANREAEAAAVGEREGRITAAETAAGVTFEAAEKNYIPALSAHGQALAAHTAAIARIDTESGNRETQILAEATDAATLATQQLTETLDTIGRDLLADLKESREAEATAIGEREGQITAAEARTGLTFEAALINYTPAVDLNTQALNALNATIAKIDAEEIAARTAVETADTTDRTETSAAQQALVDDAGVSLAEARAGYVPALTSAAEATLTLNTTIGELDKAFREETEKIYNAGLVDSAKVDAAVQAAIAKADTQQTVLETAAGISFPEAVAALAAYGPEPNALTQAGLDRSATLSDIDAEEKAGIEGVNAQAIADRLQTDADITAARDTYTLARDAAILEHNTAIRELGIQEAADIGVIKETLKTELSSIDDTLDAELTEIREQKIAFDTKMNELITAINETANLDFAQLKTDTEAMRAELEIIAQEARDNAWKSAMLKVANVGITVTGIAAGALVGGPAGAAVGGQIGAAVGGLVEQGGNELFHYEQTDALVRRLARDTAYRQPRRAPDYLPDANQLRNARDVGVEVIDGVLQGLAKRNVSAGGAVSGTADVPKEFVANITLQTEEGAILEWRNQRIALEEFGL